MNSLTRTALAVNAAPADDDAFDRLRRDLRDADVPADDWGPETDAWRWELAPDPDDDDRAWWARQDGDGGTVEGEADRSELCYRTTPALDWRLDRMAEAIEAQDRHEAGYTAW